MGSRFVTVATFSTAIEAHLARTRLESEGIGAFVADDNIVGLNWLYSNAVGGVKLQVENNDLVRAQELLLETEDLSNQIPGEEKAGVYCMNCGSAKVQYEEKPRTITWISFWVLALPLPLKKRCWKCGECGTEWKV